MQNILKRNNEMDRMELSDKDEALFEAIRNKDLDNIASIMEEANIHAKSMWDGAPINLAVRLGNVEIVKLLCEKGADIESKDATDMTPLMNACLEGHEQVAEFLLDLGAKITSDLVMSLSQKVRILEENAQSGMVKPEAAQAWRDFLDRLLKRDR